MPISKLKASSIASGTLDNARIPSLAASKIGSGTFADARIAASNVSQHATSFDDDKLVNDISTLALKEATTANRAASNTNSQYVDVFNDDSGYTNGANTSRSISEYVSAVSVSYSTPAFITSDQSSVYSFSYANFTIDNSYPLNASAILGTGNSHSTSGQTWYFSPNSQSVNSDMRLVFDLGSGNSKIFTGGKIIQEQVNACGVWQWQLSNNGTDYTNFGSTASWGTSSTIETTWSNDSGYRYIRLVGVSGTTSSSPWQYGFQFQTKTATETPNATGNFTCPNITAASATTKMGAVITYQDNAGTNALNTDIVLQLSADGGSNYSTATLTALPDFSTGIKMAKVNDLTVTSGTSLKYKILFANQSSGVKEARIRGVSLNY